MTKGHKQHNLIQQMKIEIRGCSEFTIPLKDPLGGVINVAITITAQAKRKEIYICEFQVSALNEFGMVGRHLHFILSKYFI